MKLTHHSPLPNRSGSSCTSRWPSSRGRPPSGTIPRCCLRSSPWSRLRTSAAIRCCRIFYKIRRDRSSINLNLNIDLKRSPLSVLRTHSIVNPFGAVVPFLEHILRPSGAAPNGLNGSMYRSGCRGRRKDSRDRPSRLGQIRIHNCGIEESILNVKNIFF